MSAGPSAGPSSVQPKSRPQWNPPQFRAARRLGSVPPRNYDPSLIWTCQASDNYTPLRGHFSSDGDFAKAIPLQKGDQLFAIDPTNQNRYPNVVLVSYGDGDLEGLVLRQFLTRGTLLKRPTITNVAPQFSQLASTSNVQGTVLQRTISMLMREFDARRAALEAVGCTEDALGFIHRHCNNLSNIIYAGINSDLRPIIENGRATFADMYRLPHVQTNARDDRTVIYILFYEGIPDTGHGSNGMYAGKTEHLGIRFASHDSALKPNSSVPGSHYKIARPARNKKLILFAEFTRGTADIASILQVAEQICQMLFGTMNPVLFTEELTGVEEGGSRWCTDALAAQSLRSLAGTVFQKTGWMPPAGVHGCNWSSAITEGTNAKPIWLCQEVRDQANHTVLTFTRGGKSATVGESAGALRFHLVAGGRDKRGRIVIRIPDGKDQGLSAGMAVYPVVEIYNGAGDISHPVPFGRLPEPGPFSDWESLNRLGIRIEWQMPSGEWRTRYCQANALGQLWSLTPKAQCATEEDHYASGPYKKVSCIVDTFMKVDYNTPQVPSFKKLGPGLIIKKFAYDHLNQTVVLADLPPARKQVPTLVSFRQNADRLIQMFPNLAIGKDRPTRGLRTHYTNPERTVCDLCYSVDWIYREKGNMCPTDAGRGDPQYGDHNSCLSCEALRRPCHYQAGVVASSNQQEQPAHAARLFIRAARTEYWTIPGPTHLAHGVERYDATSGPGEDELEDDVVDDVQDVVDDANSYALWDGAVCLSWLGPTRNFIWVFAGCLDTALVVYLPELFPNHLRAKGMALGVASLCLTDLILLQVTPIAFRTIGWKFYLVFISVTAAGTVWEFFMIPETKGLPLEEIAALFGESEEVTVFAANIHVNHTNHDLVVEEDTNTEHEEKGHIKPLSPGKMDIEATHHVESSKVGG